MSDLTPTTKTWIVVDLDGTICNIDHRVHLAHAKQWDEFNDLCDQDTPYETIVTLVEIAARAGLNVLVVTGRTDNNKTKTTAWLTRQNVKADHLLMRPEGDFRPDVEVKLGLIESFFGSKERVLESVLFALDDRDKVVQAMRDYGLDVLQVREGDY